MAERQESETSTSFKVNDKRRFDSEGNERSRTEAVVEPIASKSKVERSSIATDEDQDTSEEPMPPSSAFDFSSFVMSLASQALWQLGIMPPPEGMDVPIDKEAARQTIEILDMLKQKTKGNLDEVEARLMRDILHELRINYVKLA
jgi:Domain of unknown function (DUF1844)